MQECQFCFMGRVDANGRCTVCGADNNPPKGKPTGEFDPENLWEIPVGTMIDGRYEVIRELGRGGMGVVYHVVDNRKKKNEAEDLALKIINPALIESMEARRLFEEEIDASKKMRDDNIVTVYWWGVWQDTIYYIMEYLKGVTLRSLIDARRMERPKEAKEDTLFSLEEMQAIVQPVLKALSYAHQKTIHRDIKPENIMILGKFPDIRVKVLDFGVAKPLTASKFSRTVTVAGTAYYMAPEQVMGHREISARSDLYSVGMVIYEMLTGDLAVGRFPPLKNLIADVPLHINDAVEKSFAFNPMDRFPTAEAMGGVLFGEGGVMPKAEIKPPNAEIGAGVVDYPGGLQFEVGAFRIDRNPITYGQFSLFLDMVPNTVGAASYHRVLFQSIWTEPGLAWLERHADERLSGPFEIQWSRAVGQVAWYEAVAFCNWRSIVSLAPDLFKMDDGCQITEQLERLLYYDYEGKLRQNAKGMRLPTEFEVILAHRRFKRQDQGGVSNGDLYELTTNTFLETGGLRPYSLQQDPLPFYTQGDRTIVNGMEKRSWLNPNDSSGMRRIFRCVQTIK